MVLRASVVVVLSALLSLPALAQDGDAGDGGSLDGGLEESDGGLVPDDDGGFTGDCTPACDGEVLRFCDDGEPVSLDCTETGATCGLLSDEWGFDCVLPAGAACDPGYAEGLSRCDGAGDATTCCVDAVCADPGEPASPDDRIDCHDFAPETPEHPDTSSTLDDTPAAASCLGLAGCEGIPLLSFVPLLFGLRLLGRRRGRP